jgi:hypothetical protein
MKKIILLLCLPLISFSGFSQTQTDSLIGFAEKHELDHIMVHGIDSSQIDFYLDLAKRRYINRKYNLGFYAPPENLISSSAFDCAVDNWGFENGTFGGWNQQGAVEIVSNGVDPYGGFSWVYPNGGNFSAKISSDQDGFEDGRLDKVLNVPANGESLMSFHFAMSIFNYPHPANAAAKLWVEFYDASGNTLSCPQYECYYSTDYGAIGVNNFQVTPQAASYYNPAANGDCPSCHPVTYADWNTVTLDLSSYQGQQITAVFRVEWCIYGPDWAYVLLDVDCPITNFEPTNVCLNETGQGTLCGPDNMFSYTWYDSSGTVVGNNQCLDVNASGTYVLESAPLVECTSASLLTFDFIVYPSASMSYLVSNYNGNNISCNGYNDGSIDISVNGAQSYDYLWSNGELTEDIDMLFAGNYLVIVTDTNGCSTYETILLSEPTLLQTTIVSSNNYNGYDISCNGYSDGGVDLTVTGSVSGYTYLWDDPLVQNTATATGLSSGIYSVDITDANGCFTSDSFFLNQPTPLISNYTVSEINGYGVTCHDGQDGFIDLTVSGSVPVYSYVWNNSETTEDLGNLGAGTYSYTVTDQNGCITTDTIEITEPILNIQEYVNDVSCFGGINGAVSVIVSGSTAPYYVFWDNNINPNLLPSGTYVYQIIDSIGCSYIDSLIVSDVDSFVVVENITNVSCNGFNDGEIVLDVTGATPPYIVDWFGYSTINMSAGTYNFTILDSNNCAYSEIAIVSEPNPIDVLNQVVDPLCGNTNDGSVSLVISGGTPVYYIDWGVNNPDSLAIGTYEFVIIDDNNCIDSNSVTLIAESNIQVISSVTEISCNTFCDGAIDLQINGGVAPYILDWFSFNSAALCEGIVSYNLIDAVGCSYSESFLMVPPDSVDLIINQIGMQLEANASGGVSPYSYEWFNDLGSLVSSQNVNITFNGNYYCIAIDANHCQSDTITYFYSETSINDSEISNFNIYPNPSEGFLIVECNSIQNSDLTVNLIDVLGKYVHLDTKKSFTGEYKNQIDLYNYAKGVYFINIKLNNQNHYKKLILQ